MSIASRPSRVLRPFAPIAAALALIGVTACNDAPSAPAPRATPRAAGLHALRSSAALAQHGRAPRTASERLADLHPKFGGAFVDPKTHVLHVYLSDLADAPAAQSVLEAAVRSNRPELSLHLERGRFSYRQLEAWRDSLLPAFGAGRGVTTSEIDERNNRLRVGVRDEAARAGVVQAAARAGIPDSAVAVEVAPAYRTFASLRDHNGWTLRAGLQIETTANQPGYGQWRDYCTLGPGVNWGGSYYVLTNSHCTEKGGIGAYIGAYAAQPFFDDFSNNLIGSEAQDLQASSGLWRCPPGGTCRYSDAALFGSDQYYTPDIGAIVRTTQRGTLPTVYASLTVSTSGPIRLSGILQDVYVGDIFEKIGRTTGWSAGEVTSTSKDVTPYGDPVTRLDNIEVHAASGGGDSGSPVFFQASTGNYFLAGMLWGGTSDYDGHAGTTFVLSKWKNIDYELGQYGVPDLDPINGVTGDPTCVQKPGGPPCPL